jgi:hypothetical protein
VRGFVAFNRSHSIQDSVFCAHLPVWLHQPLQVSYRSHPCGGSAAHTLLCLRIENTSADTPVSLIGAVLDQKAPLNTRSDTARSSHVRHDSIGDGAADAAAENAWRHAVAPIVPTRDPASNASGDQCHRTLGSEFSARLLEADLPQVLAPGEVFHLGVALEPRHAMAATTRDVSLSSSQSSAADIDDLLGKPSARWLSTRRVFPRPSSDNDNVEWHHTPISLTWQLCDQGGHARANPISMMVGVTWRSSPQSGLVVSFLGTSATAP